MSDATHVPSKVVKDMQEPKVMQKPMDMMDAAKGLIHKLEEEYPGGLYGYGDMRTALEKFQDAYDKARIAIGVKRPIEECAAKANECLCCAIELVRIDINRRGENRNL